MSTAESRLDQDSIDQALPSEIYLQLNVTDPDVIREVSQKQEGREREEYALAALRLGTLALRQARGEIDAQSIRHEGERMLASMAQTLVDHQTHLDRVLTGTLKKYFDPADGRFNERIDRLIKKDGELENILSAQLTAENSTMSRTLSNHIGETSPLFKLLSPTESDGLLKTLDVTIRKNLDDQQNSVLREFSLDNEKGALSRVVKKLSDSNGKLTDDVQGKINEMLNQFSFDDDNSAISRMRKTVDDTKDTISKHLTLDDKDSALSRLRKELVELLKQHAEGAQSFQNEVKSTLDELRIRKEERAISTKHGDDFEGMVFAFLQKLSHQQGDISQHTGKKVGFIKNCLVGDIVIELGNEAAAAGSRIVVEAKEDHSYDLPKAMQEINKARSNRAAEVGVFVFSRQTAPIGIEPIFRQGDNVIVVWDKDDPSSDVLLTLGLSVAKALCSKGALEKAEVNFDFEEIDRSLLDIAKQVEMLDEIRPLANTIVSNSEKILDRLRISRKKLLKQSDLITEALHDLKAHVSNTDGSAE